MGPSLCRTIRSFYENGFLLKELNRTNIILISKYHNLIDIHQFCRISLCNFIYKVISKTVVNHLKPRMHSLIPNDHNAFIPSRAIHDNIVIAHEIFHYLKTFSSLLYFIAPKLDTYKAYNQVDWNFLRFWIC